MKIELILPDDLDERYWEQVQNVRMDYLPIKGSVVNACNSCGYSQPFIVTGTRTVFQKTRWGKKVKNNRVYLEKCEWPQEFSRKKMND
jgi:hypothetical protein